MKTEPLPWLLLIVSIPGNSTTARTRIWRAVKALGCSALRDGAYLLPNRPNLHAQLHELASETTREGGTTRLLNVQADTPDESAGYVKLFSRASDYAELSVALLAARSGIKALAPQEIARSVRKLRKEYDRIVAIDYFPDETSRSAKVALADFQHVANTLLARGEPQPVDATIEVRAKEAFQGRVWATRRGLWVDRVASAWLIRRFIDLDARFLWFGSPADVPADALGFDFDGAQFTHVGERVTFEVLLASFGLLADAGLLRLGAIVHALDVGGDLPPEASGFEAMLAGARQRCNGDDQLLEQMSIVFDSLHAHFNVEAGSPGDSL